MIDITTTEARRDVPVDANWTIGGLLEWIAADDDRCHDDGLRMLLLPLDRALTGDEPTTAGTVALVRALAREVREQPLLGKARISDVAGSAHRIYAAAA